MSYSVIFLWPLLDVTRLDHEQSTDIREKLFKILLVK